MRWAWFDFDFDFDLWSFVSVHFFIRPKNTAIDKHENICGEYFTKRTSLRSCLLFPFFLRTYIVNVHILLRSSWKMSFTEERTKGDSTKGDSILRTYAHTYIHTRRKGRGCRTATYITRRKEGVCCVYTTGGWRRKRSCGWKKEQ